MRTLLAVTAAVAVVLAALSQPSQFWTTVIVTATFLTLGVSLLGVMLLSGRARAFWLGFAVLGWMQFLVHFAQLPLAQLFPYDFLWPDSILVWLAERHTNADSRHFAGFLVGYVSTLITGFIGGLLGLWFAERKCSQPAESRVRD